VAAPEQGPGGRLKERGPSCVAVSSAACVQFFALQAVVFRVSPPHPGRSAPMSDPGRLLPQFSAGSAGRRRLHDRHECVGLDFELGGMAYHATVSRFPDGQPGEVFINAAKSDSTADIVARDSAVAVSLALQFGCPIDVLRLALMRDSRGGPSGPAAFVLDAIASESGSTG
jgi:hypothetical protein